MVKDIRLHIEGDEALRVGFGQLFDRLRNAARQKRIGWKIIMCGNRDESFRNFKTALATHAESLNILLVDAEGPVNQPPWRHLEVRDQWGKPENVGDG